jgi:hypothetical protein
MSNSFMDILSEKGKLEACKIILLTVGRNGATPTIERISAEHFFIKLRTALGWPEETINRIRHILEKNGKVVNEPLGSPSIEQLRQLGFVGLDIV